MAGTPSRYLRINFPFLWRTRIHVVLPIFVLIGIYLPMFAGKKPAEIWDCPSVEEIKFRFGWFLAIPIIVYGFWWFQNLKFPIQAKNKRQGAFAFTIYFMGCLTAQIGPLRLIQHELNGLSEFGLEKRQSAADIAKFFISYCSQEKQDTAQLTDKLGGLGLHWYHYSRIQGSPELANCHVWDSTTPVLGNIYITMPAELEKPNWTRKLSLQEFSEKIVHMNEVLEFTEEQKGILSDYSIFGAMPVIRAALFAFILLLSGSKEGGSIIGSPFSFISNKVRGYLSGIRKATKSSLILSREYPLIYGSGLHFGLLGSLLAAAFCSVYYLIGYFLDGRIPSKSDSILVPFCFFFAWLPLWIRRQFAFRIFVRSYTDSILLIAALLLVIWFGFFSGWFSLAFLISMPSLDSSDNLDFLGSAGLLTIFMLVSFHRSIKLLVSTYLILMAISFFVVDSNMNNRSYYSILAFFIIVFAIMRIKRSDRFPISLPISLGSLAGLIFLLLGYGRSFDGTVFNWYLGGLPWWLVLTACFVERMHKASFIPRRS
jgi:hypothetical protein